MLSILQETFQIVNYVCCIVTFLAMWHTFRAYMKCKVKNIALPESNIHILTLMTLLSIVQLGTLLSNSQEYFFWAQNGMVMWYVLLPVWLYHKSNKVSFTVFQSMVCFGLAIAQFFILI